MPLTDDTWGADGPSFSHDGSLFAAAWPGEGLVNVIDLASGQIVREIRSVASPNGTTFDPTGARLAITSWEGQTAVMDLASGDEVFALGEHVLYPIMDAAWSPDGQSIATASFDGGVRVFDAGTGHQRFSIHGTGGHVFGVDWAPDSARLVAGKSDGTARVWVVDEGGAREVITLSAHDTRKGIEGVAFSPDGTRVLTGDLGVTAARVWDVGIDGNAEVANLPAVIATIGAVDFTSDGRQLVATSGSGSVTVWDTQSFTRRRTLGVPSRSPTATAAQDAAPGYYAPLASGADVFSVDVSPDGRLVAVARLDGTVRVWDMETGRDAFTVDAGPLEAPFGTVSWNPDGDLLAIAANDGRTGRATVVDRSGRVVAVLQEEFGIALMGLTFTPDSAGLITTRLATGPTSPDVGGVVRWDWREGRVAPIIDTPAKFALASPTGRLVATTAPLRTLVGSSGPGHIWDAATGRRVATLGGNTGVVLDLAFSADGTRLAASGQDNIVGIWDPTSGEQLLVLRGHYTSVFSVAFSPDGSRLASVGSEGVVRVWTLDIDELVEIARDELTRTLTDEECRQYLHQQACD
jgi:WD40 repeat protein